MASPTNLWAKPNLAEKVRKGGPLGQEMAKTFFPPLGMDYAWPLMKCQWPVPVCGPKAMVKAALSVGVFVSFSPQGSEPNMVDGWAKKQSSLLHVHLPSLYMHPNINAQTSLPPLCSPPETSLPTSPQVSSGDPKGISWWHSNDKSQTLFLPKLTRHLGGEWDLGFRFPRTYYLYYTSEEIFPWHQFSRSGMGHLLSPLGKPKFIPWEAEKMLRRPETW